MAEQLGNALNAAWWARLSPWVVLPLALALYVIVSLWPFEWEPPTRVTNGVERSTAGGLEFDAPGLAISHSPPAWIADARESGSVDVSLRVRSLAVEQAGPARILSVSGDPYSGNLMIGQDRHSLVVRMRTPATDAKGTVQKNAPLIRVRHVFDDARWIDIDLRIRPGHLEVAIDHTPRGQADLPPDALRRWDPSYRLALGNEVSGNRPWLGHIARAEVRVGESPIDHLQMLELDTPAVFWSLHNSPRMDPIAAFDARDAIRNVAMYVPLGFVLAAFCVSSHGRARGGALALVTVIAVSLSLEALQMLFDRNPAVADVLCNALGGGLGIAALTVIRPILGGSSAEEGASERSVTTSERGAIESERFPGSAR